MFDSEALLPDEEGAEEAEEEGVGWGELRRAEPSAMMADEDADAAAAAAVAAWWWWCSGPLKDAERECDPLGKRPPAARASSGRAACQPPAKEEVASRLALGRLPPLETAPPPPSPCRLLLLLLLLPPPLLTPSPAAA